MNFEWFGWLTKPYFEQTLVDNLVFVAEFLGILIVGLLGMYFYLKVGKK